MIGLKVIGSLLVLSGITCCFGQDPCTAAIDMRDHRRTITNKVSSSSGTLFCDDRIQDDTWYRFKAYTGSFMPTSCVDMYRCGTKYPIYMKGDGHPKEFGIINNAKACINYGGCCDQEFNIEVKLCKDDEGNYPVYRLQKVPFCAIAYCIGAATKCPTGQELINGQCAAPYPRIKSSPKLDGPFVTGDAENFDFRCTIPYDKKTTDDGARFLVTFTFDGSAGYSVNVSSVEHIAVMPGKEINGYMGKRLRCTIESFWATSSHVKSDPFESDNSYYLGIVTYPAGPIRYEESNGDELIEITFNSTVPLILHENQNKKIPKEFTVNIKGKGKFSFNNDPCSLRFDDKAWTGYAQHKPAKLSLQVKPDMEKKDSVGSVEFDAVNSGHLIGFDKYVIPQILVEIADNERTGICSSTGDPHTTTFDKKKYDNYAEGVFLLFENPKLQLRVEVIQKKCGAAGAACISQVAVRQHNTILALKGDTDSAQMTELMLENNKRGYIKPTSATTWMIEMAAGLTVNLKKRKQWLDVYVNASSFHKYKDVKGLCGNFNGNDKDEYDGMDPESSKQPKKFIERHRVPPINSLFSRSVACTSEGNSLKFECKCRDHTQGIVECNFGHSKAGEEAVKVNHNCDGWGKRSATFSDTLIDPSEYYSQQKPIEEAPGPDISEITFPTMSGITEEQAQAACYDVIMNHPAATACKKEMLDEIAASCGQDVLFVDDLDEARLSFDIVSTECKLSAEAEVIIKEDASEEEIQAAYATVNQINTVSCPANCSKRGDCVDGKCECHGDYVGDDCSGSIHDVPALVSISLNSACDRYFKECKNVRIVARKLLDLPTLACRVVPIEKTPNGDLIRNDLKKDDNAILLSFGEVQCNLAAFADLNIIGYLISLSNNGFGFSDSLQAKVHHSGCLTPKQSSVFINNGYCYIEGKCWRNGDTKDGKECDTAASPFSWTISKSDMYSQWSEWGACTVGCGEQTQNRSRKCLDTANCGSEVLSEARKCAADQCTGAGMFSVWSDWGACSTGCGQQTQNRSRKCIDLEKCNNDNQVEVQNCGVYQCSDLSQDEFTAWSAWGACSDGCGESLKKRRRRCKDSINCNTAMLSDSRSCGVFDCIAIQSTANSEWSGWTSCPEPCFPAIMSRTRIQNRIKEEQTKPCPTKRCSTKPSETEPSGSPFGEWSSWSSCSTACGYGVSSRTRNCGGYFSCYNKDIKRCFMKPCGKGKVGTEPITYSSWTEWSNCPATCRISTQNRRRRCTGSSCSYSNHLLIERRNCPIIDCKENTETDDIMDDSTNLKFGLPDTSTTLFVNELDAVCSIIESIINEACASSGACCSSINNNDRPVLLDQCFINSEKDIYNLVQNGKLQVPITIKTKDDVSPCDQDKKREKRSLEDVKLIDECFLHNTSTLIIYRLNKVLGISATYISEIDCSPVSNGVDKDLYIGIGIGVGLFCIIGVVLTVIIVKRCCSRSRPKIESQSPPRAKARPQSAKSLGGISIHVSEAEHEYESIRPSEIASIEYANLRWPAVENRRNPTPPSAVFLADKY